MWKWLMRQAVRLALYAAEHPEDVKKIIDRHVRNKKLDG